QYWTEKLLSFPIISEVRGLGLMLGFDLPESNKTLRKDLLSKHFIFTGEAKPNTVRLLPSLALTKEEADLLIEAMAVELEKTVSA
ncbi:MAG TPA: aminotransferase class III-fold pyridoxal phosphate-dependent enzyme, partial [Cyclobacteriaceae bacterium]|nr:aminotransferase class III-fold pyridoxal phosphate-dependent enzyme [Cyclobacteriaceae bacterium]